MSVKVYIDENKLGELTKGKIDAIFSSVATDFRIKHYLQERYTRKKQIILMVNTADDVELKPMVAIESQLVDTATGYGLGKPATYYDKTDKNFKKEKRYNLTYGISNDFIKKLDETKNNEYLDKLLEIFDKNDISAHDMAILRDCLITGSADEMVFIDSNTGEIEIARISDDCIALYNNELKSSMYGFIRKVVNKDPLLIDGSVYKYEVYTNNYQVAIDENGIIKPLNYGGLGINSIPFIRYDIGMPYISKLIAEVRAYELVTNNTKKILNFNDDSILKIRGYAFTEGKTDGEIDKAVREFKEKGVLFLDADEGTDADWLTKNINDGANENHKRNLKDDIYTVAGTFNPANDNQVYQNTLSLMFKLYGLETKMVGYLGQLRKGFRKRCKKITDILNFKYKTNYDSSVIDMTFTRDVPTSTNEELNLINQAREFLPLAELYKMVSFVENPDEMVEKWKNWQLELTKLEIEKEKMRASALESDIQPDRVSEDEKE